MTATLTVGGVDISSATAYAVSVATGRDDIDAQPEAATLSATVHGWSPAGNVGDPCTLTDAAGQMFGGTVTDLDADLDAAGAWRVRLTAVGPLADLGRVVIGDEPWPVETDTDRMIRVLDSAGAPHAVTVGITGPQLLAVDVDRRAALEVAQAAASDALGVLWEQPADPDLPIRYLPARLRAWEASALAWGEQDPALSWGEVGPGVTWAATSAGPPPAGDPGALHLDAAEVLAAEVSYSQRIGDLARLVRVTYGLAPEGGSRPEVRHGGGLPEISRTTDLADFNGAAAVADILYRSRREPSWRISGLVVPLSTLPAARQTEIRAALGIGCRLTIGGIGYAPPTGPSWQGYLEGWTHDLVWQAGRAPSHTVTLQTSERALTEPADRWADVAPTLAWAEAPMAWADTVNMP